MNNEKMIKFSAYVYSRMVRKNIPYHDGEGRLVNIGETISFDGARTMRNYYIRYGTDNDFSLWVEAPFIWLVWRRFYRCLKK